VKVIISSTTRCGYLLKIKTSCRQHIQLPDFQPSQLNDTETDFADGKVMKFWDPGSICSVPAHLPFFSVIFYSSILNNLILLTHVSLPFKTEESSNSRITTSHLNIGVQ
jgi:hypothetical protein